MSKTIPFPEEISSLKNILSKIDNALEKSINEVNHQDKEYMDLKRYLADYRREIDPAEIFQGELLLKGIERSGIHAVAARDKLAKMKESPYFARIDFLADDTGEKEIFYIGRFNFADDSDLLIYDWRAPVSSMFYDYELGRAAFEAPMGRVEGELTRRRQFQIRSGRMEYALESSINIQDNVLQQVLSSTSDKKMRTIISSLQKEQNAIIRNEKVDKMIIQGVAGSGKTSIALHRIAYLLYRHQSTLSAQNVVILSPNRVFGDYISSVLPELGEEPIYEMSFTDIAEIQLAGVIGFEPERDPFENDDDNWGGRAKWKTSMDFLKLMDSYLDQAASEIFDPEDYTYGRFTVSRQWMLDRYRAYKGYPVKRRLKEIASDIYERFQGENYLELELPKERTILKALVKMLKINTTLGLYKDFYKKTMSDMPGIFMSSDRAKPLVLAELADLFVMPGKKTLEWADVYPFLYFHACFEGLKENRLIRHLVIDEMQDYSPVQYAVLNIMFQCKMTILGDFGQSINPYQSGTLADLQSLYPEAKTVMLNKSYRSSYEIILFAKRIQHVKTLEPAIRHGEIPQVIRCQNPADELEKIKRKLEAFLKGEYVTLGIILKTNRDAEAFHEALVGSWDNCQSSQNCQVQLLTPESNNFESGITVTAVGMAKGLEFDEVIIPSADDKTYGSEHDRSLLYVACTRAMHKLTLFFSGAPTKIIGKI